MYYLCGHVDIKLLYRLFVVMSTQPPAHNTHQGCVTIIFCRALSGTQVDRVTYLLICHSSFLGVGWAYHCMRSIQSRPRTNPYSTALRVLSLDKWGFEAD